MKTAYSLYLWRPTSDARRAWVFGHLWYYSDARLTVEEFLAQQRRIPQLVP